jgi:hypothetical protein
MCMMYNTNHFRKTELGGVPDAWSCAFFWAHGRVILRRRRVLFLRECIIK